MISLSFIKRKDLFFRSPVVAGDDAFGCDRCDIESKGYIHVLLSGLGSWLILDTGMRLFGDERLLRR